MGNTLQFLPHPQEASIKMGRPGGSPLIEVQGLCENSPRKFSTRLSYLRVPGCGSFKNFGKFLEAGFQEILRASPKGIMPRGREKWLRLFGEVGLANYNSGNNF